MTRATVAAAESASTARTATTPAPSAAEVRVSDLTVEDYFNLVVAATRAGIDGAEMGLRDDGRDGRGRINARQNRQMDRRAGSRGAR